MFPPLDPANPLYCILIYYIDTTYASGKLGPGGGGGGEHTFKLKMLMTLFLKYLTANKFALIHVSMIRMCNTIKIKASLFQKYPLWLVLRQKLVAKTLGNHVFCSLNTVE